MSNEEDPTLAMVEFDGNTVSLADLAGLDMSDLGEARFSNLPRGFYKFRVEGDDKMPRLAKLGDKFGAVFNVVVEDVLTLVDRTDAPDGDPTKLIGKSHRETQFITSQESFKYLNAFITDLGGLKVGAYGDKFQSLVGIVFTAPIAYRKDRNDTSKEYAFIKADKIRIISKPGMAAAA